MKKPGQPAIAKSDVALAHLLKTDRKSLRRWRKGFPSTHPRDLNVRDWREFLRDNLLGPFSAQRRYGESESPLPTPDARPCESKDLLRVWRTKYDELSCARVEQKTRAEARELTITAELETALGLLLVAIHEGITNLMIQSARRVRGLNDFHAVAEILQAQCDALLHGLYRCEYLNPSALDAIIRAQPVPAGVEAVPWRASLRAMVIQTLRKIGRLALPAQKKSDLPPEDHETTAHAADENTS